MSSNNNIGISNYNTIEEMVSAAVDAGVEKNLETVDFNDPSRPKTCLEVDFPIIPINQIAQIEGNAGKPIYQMSKWWARRRSSVFRSMLIAAAAKAPKDPEEAAKLIWNSYYGNHQKNSGFRNLKVADIFMGGGTTLVEGARLGMQMSGNDLNPVAWLVVKNELSNVNLDEVRRLFQYIEAEVKPQLLPFYICEGPNGESGKWYSTETGELMKDSFDPLAIAPEERKLYQYYGPEVIYTFWAKHGPCSVPGCNHRTPLMSNPVVSVKTISVKHWPNQKCDVCESLFDIEAQEVRIAPDTELVIAANEKPFTILNKNGQFRCPHCGEVYSKRLPKSKNKSIQLTLLIHPQWLTGATGMDEKGALGGTATSDVEATQRWDELRQSKLRLIEFRGELPEKVTLSDYLNGLNTNSGNIPQSGVFTCKAETCGKKQKIVSSMESSGRTSPVSQFALQCFSPERQKLGVPYNGRYFKEVSVNDIKRYQAAIKEWEERSKTDLKDYWPKSTIPFGHMTNQRQPLPAHGYSHWYTMFNSRQLLIHALVLKSIDTAFGFSDDAKEIALGVFQQYLRNQNMFCFWNSTADKMEPMFSNNNFHPKSTVIENSVFSDLGRGNLASCFANTLKGLEWKTNVWETASNEMLNASKLFTDSEFSSIALTGKGTKVYTGDSVLPGTKVTCGSSTDLSTIPSLSHDLVITDPPFGGLLHYSELADFFYVWLRLVLKDKYPEYFSGEYTPKTLEAVANKARHPEDSDDFYKRLLTECWRESNRILKPGGILAFTFHHSEDEPWVDVLESLFEAGFYLEATYPIRSDETKGQGEFGSKTIEYDIIHVCRKRNEETSKISWPRLRRQILTDVRQIQELLEHHQQSGLPKADIEVIKRGKALEYFSRHYGKVYVEEGREFSVKEALIGINQILDDQSEGESVKAPSNAEPLTRQFLRIFAQQSVVPRDQMQKFLRGSGIAPSDFIANGWCQEITRPKAFQWSSPLNFAQSRSGIRSTKRDLDQALFLIGSCYPESGINVNKLMANEDFKPHPALGELLDWLGKNGPDVVFRNGAMVAKQLFTVWAAEHQTVMAQQLSIFDLT